MNPPAPARRLRGNLGVASIVFMVVAAAAPLGVIGGVVPLGIAAGNGAGFPATFVVSTVILLFFAVGFTALTPYVEEAGAFFSYVRNRIGLPGGYRHRVRRARQLRGDRGRCLRPARPGRRRDRRTVRRPGPAVVGFRGGGIRRSRPSSGTATSSCPAGCSAVLLTAEIAIVVVLDLVIVFQGGDHGLSTGIVNPSAIFSGSLGIGLLFALISYVGFEATAIFRDEARDTGAHDSARHLCRADPDRRVLRGDQLGADLRMGRRRSGQPGHGFRRHVPRRHRTALHRRRRHRHHHRAVLHQPVRLHPRVPQRGIALRLRTVAARCAARVVEPPAR